MLLSGAAVHPLAADPRRSAARGLPGPGGGPAAGQRGPRQPGRLLRLGPVRHLATRPADPGLLRRPPRHRLFRVAPALNNNWISGVGAWDALLDEHPTDLALVDKRLPVYNLMRLKAGWTLVYEDCVVRLVRAEQGAACRGDPPHGAERPAGRRRRDGLSRVRGKAEGGGGRCDRGSMRVRCSLPYAPSAYPLPSSFPLPPSALRLFPSSRWGKFIDWPRVAGGGGAGGGPYNR